MAELAQSSWRTASTSWRRKAGETSNFLIPNGTFFFVLLIFLIVLGVIAKWVVPPVGKVLGEREAMLAKTTADNNGPASRSRRHRRTTTR